MKNCLRSALRVLGGMTLTAAVGISSAQTSDWIRQDEIRRYNQQQEQQRQSAEAARRQEEDARRREQENERNMQDAQRQQPSPQYQQDHQLEQARQAWLRRPPLPVDRNPLLGKWQRPASTRTGSSDPFAAVFAMAKGGLCELLFGGGIFEFRPDRLVGMDERTREQELDRVEYRGDAKRVVVLPKTTVKLIEFDFETPNRINWASQKCVLVRVGAAPDSASATKHGTETSAAAAPSARSDSATGGVLSFSVGAPSAGSKVDGRGFLVFKQDPQVTLIRAGLKSTPNGTVLQNWMRACIARTADCEKGARALQVHRVGVAMTDATGHAQTSVLPAGRYWVFSDAKVGNRRLMWNEFVDLKTAGQSLTFDERNAMPVE